MSTGISISSINRIKELAEERKFKEALEILDTQNLEKSINPQFLKISGEIFRENKRYYDCRKILLKAHQMAPQGTRIIQELIQLYLELGYFSKAQKYYEQYTFYVTPEDTQKDYVEYIMKKATGADVKDLAAILIPILERMPEDRWNFEAILLYDKMDRKDMALEESRYILENFKESEYVQPVIDYIDDKLDVDKWFYVYPKEEQPEDTEQFADLIELEEKILEADHLRMYPPEARIMVEADDNDADEVAPVKEKKPKKARGLFKKNSKNAEDVVDGEINDNVVNSDVAEKNATEQTLTKNESDKSDSDEANQLLDDAKDDRLSKDTKAEDDKSDANRAELKSDSVSDDTTSEDKKNENDETTENVTEELSQEEQVKQEREAALEKILSKKLDKDKIKESAKQVAKAVKEIDTDKAKKQVKSVATTVKDNVKKATDVIGGAVGTKVAAELIENATDNKVIPDEELIMDGIIEGVLEPPKKAVGEVVMNEELDAIIPDSLEAMSEKEIADREARKEEIERLELEALETTLKLEEEKKAKRQARLKFGNNEADSDADATTAEEHDVEQSDSESSLDKEQSSEIKDSATISSETKDEKASTKEDETKTSETQKDEKDTLSDDDKTDKSEEVNISTLSDNSSYAELKNRFMEEMEDDKPLESLGFMTVVHSDVDSAMEEAMPDAAGMLRQMIGNKEFYSGENSLGFESEASYLNHGFEVEDCDFDTYRKQLDAEQEEGASAEESIDTSPIESADEETVEEMPAVEEIFAQENVVAFEEVAEELVNEELVTEEPITEEPAVEELVIEEPVYEEPTFVEEVQEPIYEKVEELVIKEPIAEEPEVEELVIEEPVYEEPTFVEEVQEPIYEAVEELVIEEPITEELAVQELVIEEPVTEEPAVEELVYEEEPVYEEPTFVEELQEPIYEAVEELVIEEPITEELAVEELLIEEPIAEELKVEELVIEEPIAEEPKVEELVIEEPIAEEPVYEEPTFVEEVQEPIYEEVEELVNEEPIAQKPVFEEPVFGSSLVFDEPTFVEEPIFKQASTEFVYDERVREEISSVETVVETELDLRAHLRANIILSARMENILQELKGK